MFLVRDPVISLPLSLKANPNLRDESCETSGHQLLSPVLSLRFTLCTDVIGVMWLTVLFPEDQGSMFTLPTQQKKS